MWYTVAITRRIELLTTQKYSLYILDSMPRATACSRPFGDVVGKDVIEIVENKNNEEITMIRNLVCHIFYTLSLLISSSPTTTTTMTA